MQSGENLLMKLRRLWEFPAWVLGEQLTGFRLSREVADFKALNPTCRIGQRVEIRSPARLVVGLGVMLDTGALLHCGGFAWSDGQGSITLGDRTYVGPYSVLFGAGGITTGRDVLISPHVVITSHQHSLGPGARPICELPTRFEAVTIEDDVWIGSGAVVLPGVTIGAGSVVGAGAVVATSIPSRCVALGVPARVVGTREEVWARSAAHRDPASAGAR